MKMQDFSELAINGEIPKWNNSDLHPQIVLWHIKLTDKGTWTSKIIKPIDMKLKEPRTDLQCEKTKWQIYTVKQNRKDTLNKEAVLWKIERPSKQTKITLLDMEVFRIMRAMHEVYEPNMIRWTEPQEELGAVGQTLQGTSEMEQVEPVQPPENLEEGDHHSSQELEEVFENVSE